MKNSNYISSAVLSAMLLSFSGAAMAEIAVVKSQGLLSISSDINGTVVVQIIGPDDVVLVDESYEGNSFEWAPSSGPDGAYRYDVRVTEQATSENESNESNDSNKSDYAGGSVEVVNGQIDNSSEAVQ